MLKELDCDIYALQEVDNQEGDGEDSMQMEYLSRELEMAAMPGLRIVRHSGQYGNALLTHLPIVSVHRHDLSYSRFEPRGALDVQLDLGDHKLRVIATHLGLSRSERRAQWRHLLQAVASAPAELPTVVLGDMNEWFPSSATLRDAHSILGEPLAPVAFPSFAPFLALTRIWVRPGRGDGVDRGASHAAVATRLGSSAGQSGDRRGEVRAALARRKPRFSQATLKKSRTDFFNNLLMTCEDARLALLRTAAR